MHTIHEDIESLLMCSCHAHQVRSLMHQQARLDRALEEIYRLDIEITRTLAFFSDDSKRRRSAIFALDEDSNQPGLPGRLCQALKICIALDSQKLQVIYNVGLSEVEKLRLDYASGNRGKWKSDGNDWSGQYSMDKVWNKVQGVRAIDGLNVAGINQAEERLPVEPDAYAEPTEKDELDYFMKMQGFTDTQDDLEGLVAEHLDGLDVDDVV